MTSSTLLAVLVLLPALAYQEELDPVLERAQKIHELHALVDAIPAEGERAVITLGILPAVYRSAKIERHLNESEHFAAEFGSFARGTAYLANLYLGKDELKPDTRDKFTNEVAKFEVWLERMRQSGMVAYDAEEPPPVYVGPGVDPLTEELRVTVRLLFNRSAEVPKDPVIGDELYSNVATLAVLVSLPADSNPKAVEHFVRVMRYFSALFRLSFRNPKKMHYADADRDLVVEYLQRTFRVAREFVATGFYPEEAGNVAIEAVKRLKQSKLASDHQEL